MPRIGEAGLAEPGCVFVFAITGTGFRSDEHVEREERGIAGRGLIGFEDEILNHKATAGSEGGALPPEWRGRTIRVDLPDYPWPGGTRRTFVVS